MEPQQPSKVMGQIRLAGFPFQGERAHFQEKKSPNLFLASLLHRGGVGEGVKTYSLKGCLCSEKQAGSPKTCFPS